MNLPVKSIIRGVLYSFLAALLTFSCAESIPEPVFGPDEYVSQDPMKPSVEKNDLIVYRENQDSGTVYKVTVTDTAAVSRRLLKVPKISDLSYDNENNILWIADMESQRIGRASMTYGNLGKIIYFDAPDLQYICFIPRKNRIYWSLKKDGKKQAIHYSDPFGNDEKSFLLIGSSKVIDLCSDGEHLFIALANDKIIKSTLNGSEQQFLTNTDIASGVFAHPFEDKLYWTSSDTRIFYADKSGKSKKKLFIADTAYHNDNRPLACRTSDEKFFFIHKKNARLASGDGEAFQFYNFVDPTLIIAIN